jgi:hypothetical protein
MKSSPAALCATVFLVIGTSALDAQVITGPQLETGLRSGPAAYGYLSFPERYGYQTEPYIFAVGGSGRQMYYADYADKFDRAVKFGYPLPPDPYGVGKLPPHSNGLFGGGGFLFWRR